MGSRKRTWFAELIVDGAKKFSSGIHRPEDAVSIALQQDGATVCLDINRPPTRFAKQTSEGTPKVVCKKSLSICPVNFKN